MARPPSFPVVIRSGSVSVRIYRIERPAERNRAARRFFTLAWHDAGGTRRTQQFSDLEAARAEGKLKAEALAAGRSEAAVSMSMDDVALVSELRRLAGKTPPLAAMEEWVKAKSLCGEHLLTAAKAWADAHRATKSATVAEAVEAFMTAKRRAGVSMKSYEAFLPDLAEEMGEAPLTTVTASAIENWLHERYGDDETEVANPSTFNTGRKRCVALWNWARDQGLVPDTVKTQADLVHPMQEGEQPIGIISVETFARVLAEVKAKRPDLVACAALAGFTGMRRSELHKQTWEDIDLNRGLLRVTSAKKGTVAYRLVHLCPAAVEWLTGAERQEKDKETGKTPLSPPWGADRIRTLAREAKPVIEIPENAFRHSFISYKVAETGNVHETSLEAGNSPGVVRKHYLELVSKEDGAAWFALTPAAVAKIAKATGEERNDA